MPRSLPKRNNPLIIHDSIPPYEDLLTRRRLGKTHLAVKPTQIGLSNATKPENLGPFEYAHLRAPLPKDLHGSEIFPSHSPQQHPETYFLMRRSKDGYVSATGMFKIAFPWAKLDEERSEREYLKSQKETSDDEIAGNVWISPSFALELGKDYQMYDWVRALLDPAEIAQSPSSAKKQIAPPPKFDLPPLEPIPQLAPSTRTTRSRRSASPRKRASSPRKSSRQTRGKKDTGASTASAAAESLQSSLEATASTTKSETIHETVELENEANGEDTQKEPEKAPEEAADDATPRKGKKEKVGTESTATAKDDKIFKTTASSEGPSLLPDLPPEADSRKLIADAKKMVDQAKKDHSTGKKEVAGSSSAKPATKRKPVDDEEDEEGSGIPVQQVKRARVLEDTLKRERVRNRALVGVTAALAVAASIPYFF